MKTLKQAVSLILLSAFFLSSVFNIVVLLGKSGRELPQTGLLVLFAAAFSVSLLGLILKTVRKEEVYTVNIMTPVKELGIIYKGMMVIWAVTYFIAVIFK